MSALDQAFIRAYQPPATPEQTTVAEPARATCSKRTSFAAEAAELEEEEPTGRRNKQPSAMKTPAREITELASPPPQSSPARVLEPALRTITNQRLTSVVRPSARRPLSSFAQPSQHVDPGFKPALEVDQFRWSTVCNELVERYAGHFEPAINALLEADDAGRSLVGIGAAARGVGCTTVVACLARLLVKTGKTVAVVDGNFSNPGLARHLGLVVERGWEDVLAGSLPLADGVIRSLADQLVVLPLVQGGSAAGMRLDTIHSSVTAAVLRYHYDIVLFDLGSFDGSTQGLVAQRLARQCRLDGVIVTADIGAATATSPEQLVRAVPDLASLCLGVVENQLRAA